MQPVTSQYAVVEVSRNIRLNDHRQRFEALLTRTKFIGDADVRFIPTHITLVAKDQPILAAAIAASVDFLITGDISHFGPFYNTTISGVSIVSPSYFLESHKNRKLRP